MYECDLRQKKVIVVLNSSRYRSVVKTVNCLNI